MAKRVRRSNVKDGVLLPLGNGFSLVKGDHPNKVDDVDIGPNNKNGLSVNHGEILQQKGNTLRVFSAEPMLGGVSPVQLLYGGMAPDKVFAMQEQYKNIHGINDDGSRQHAQFGKDINLKNLINRINTTSNADFVKRLKDPNRKYIRKGDNIYTHLLGYVTAGDKAIVYPEVQSTDKGLKIFKGRQALDRAIENRDTLHMSIPEAEAFTTQYKNYYPGFKFGGIYPRVSGIIDLLKTRIEDWNNMAKTNNIVKKQFGGRKKFKLGGDDEDKYNTLLNNYKIAVQNRKTAIKTRDEIQKAFYDYQDALPTNVRFSNTYHWRNIPELRRLRAKLDNAENNISETTKAFFDIEEKIGEATINKYKGTNADLLVYPGWSKTEEGAKKYLIESGVRESTGAQEVADYFNSYASSPGFQRIIDNQVSWGQKRHPYRRYYNPNYTKLGFSNAARQFRNTLLDKPMTTFGVFDMSSYPGMGFNYSQYAPYNHIIINAAGNPFLNQQEEQFPYWYELTHEMLHDYNFTNDGQGEALDQNKNTKSGHDSWRNEKHSDLEALRFMLNKYNIYDSRGDKDAKAEDIKKLRDMFPKLRPLEQMDDETAAWMINHVASTNKSNKEDKRNKAQFGGQTNINSLGERPNAKYGKEMSNPVKKANKYFERKLEEENPKMSFPERLQKIHNEYKELMSPPSIEDIEKMFKKIYKGEPKRGLKKRLEKGLYNKYKLENINPQIDSSYLFNQYTINNNNSKNKRTKALYGWERDPNTGLMIPSLDFSQNKQRQILFGIHPNPANTQYNSQTFHTGISQPTVGTVPKLYEPALNVILGNKTNQPSTSTTTTTTTATTPKSFNWSDVAGTLVNGVGSILAAGINQNAINNQKFTPRRAVLLNPVKLKTKININPQLTKLREMQAQIADAARRTSGSSREAYRRILAGHNRVLESAMELYGTQENQGTQLINQDRLNQQSIANQNATNVINTHNTNIAGKDALNNNWHWRTAQNWVNPVNVIAGTVVGERGAIAREEARRNNAANLAMMSLAYPDAARMIMNGDYWQRAFNGYYNMLNNKVRV